MENPNDTGHQITARKLIEIMLYDNGAVNRLEPDNLKKYPQKLLETLTLACEVFFEKYPELLTDENLEEIAAGELEENEAKFGIYPEYIVLNGILNDYFDII